MSALFVIGTDTGVGKTFVTCALARALRAAGRRVTVMKPVETGVTDAPSDALLLRDAAGDPASLDEICPYRLRAPLAPSVAARLEGRTIDLGRIEALIRSRREAADVLLVEGAGGLLVPIVDSVTWADLAARIRLPVLMVAANRLGTVNHCALTARVADAMGLTVLGFVLSSPRPERDASADTNAAAIEGLTGLPCLGNLPHASTHASTDSLDVTAISSQLSKES